jgi:hypothetical protein
MALAFQVGGRNFVGPPILRLGGGGARGGCGNDLIGRDGCGFDGAVRTVFISWPDCLGMWRTFQGWRLDQKFSGLNKKNRVEVFEGSIA